MEKSIDYQTRLDALRAMDLIARSLNDEDFFNQWITYGIEDECKDYNGYLSDDIFRDIMTEFCEVIHNATAEKGAIFIDNICSE